MISSNNACVIIRSIRADLRTYIPLLLKRVNNHEDLLDNDPFKDEVAQEPTKRIKPSPPLRTGKWKSVKPKPVPRKSVNEDGYKPIPKPRTDRPLQIPNIKELNRALKGHAKSYNNNNKKRSHTQLDSRKQVIAFQDRVITINIKEDR